MLELCDISHGYEKVPVLSHLSFNFPEKGSFALMGPSGCGKTTLLRLIAGLEKPLGGEIRCDFRKIAMSFQEPRLVPNLTCRKNLELVLPAGSEKEKISDSLLRCFRLSEVANALPGTLSGGMKQRLSLARALSVEGDLLLLDEPFNGLDEALREQVAQHILAASTYRMILTVTHSTAEAKSLNAQILNCHGNPISSIK